LSGISTSNRHALAPAVSGFTSRVSRRVSLIGAAQGLDDRWYPVRRDRAGYLVIASTERFPSISSNESLRHGRVSFPAAAPVVFEAGNFVVDA